MEILVDAMGGETRTAPAHDPLGRPLEARYGLVRDGSTAIVEVAAASGLGLVDEPERDPERASSAGTGELIAAAIGSGARRILVAAGGSATTDGGRGAIDALQAAGGTGDAELEVLCDTSVPFERAAEVFAPQKGASPEQVERLDLAAGGGGRRPAPRPQGPGDDRRCRRPLRRALGDVRRASGSRSGVRPRGARLRPPPGQGRRRDHGRGAGSTRRAARGSWPVSSPGAAETRVTAARDHRLNRLDAAEARRRGIASVSEAGTPEAIGDAAERIAGRGVRARPRR